MRSYLVNREAELVTQCGLTLLREFLLERRSLNQDGSDSPAAHDIIDKLNAVIEEFWVATTLEVTPSAGYVDAVIDLYLDQEEETSRNAEVPIVFDSTERSLR